MQNFFQENDKNDSGPADAITAACDGLVYISETDAPFLLFAGRQAAAVTAEILLDQTDKAADVQVEEIDFDTFFVQLATIRDWYDDARKASAKRFLDLQTLLGENLSELKVFKTGRIQLDIFVVGIDKAGCLMGVTTKAVET